MAVPSNISSSLSAIADECNVRLLLSWCVLSIPMSSWLEDDDKLWDVSWCGDSWPSRLSLQADESLPPEDEQMIHVTSLGMYKGTLKGPRVIF